ncbi:uncharacterized protein LOC113780619 [Coffea eugenioides]|uniref:uncharacterized protein LOC113780619 n=1 Tax=Coffea eugenioides TaxID=49369 RepID=UPI000F5CF3F6|nr:uncharacterized protein LOC113704789 [Coffea arabica]XP_027182203.1 uncharacterized protein LOC113780619 [Coffea eugenioides]
MTNMRDMAGFLRAMKDCGMKHVVFLGMLEPDEHGRRKAICKTCGKQYLADDVSGTSNLLRHLVSHAHNEEQPTGLATVDHEIYRDKLAIAIVKHDYLFQFVEHIGIRELHLFLNFSVKSISRNTAKSDVLKIYRREKEKVKKELELVQDRICLTHDLWSSITSDGYMSLTVHYVDQNWNLQKRIVVFRHAGLDMIDEAIYKIRESVKHVFSRLQDVDDDYKLCPSEEEWHRVGKIAEFFRPFYDMTLLFSGKYSKNNAAITAAPMEGTFNSDDGHTRDLMDGFDMYQSQQGANGNKSELELYLEERLVDPSKSAFSHGGRILEKFRTSMLLDNVEALLCCRDLLYNSEDSVDKDFEVEQEDEEQDLGIDISRFIAE